MFYRQHKTFWYQFWNLKHFLKAENSEDIFASSCEPETNSLRCEQNSVTCHVTLSETELLLELTEHWGSFNQSLSQPATENSSK